MSIAWIGMLVGGVGLLLLGMRLMTEGLKVAAGRTLEAILRRATASRGRSLATGFGLTALVQSSSVVTVAAIGFVNVGLLDLSEALWVVFGSNVGTTVTSWVVAATGLDFDIEALALPMIGAGMAAQLSARHRRLGAFGKALTGFGLFFLGLGMLQTGLADVASSFVLEPIGAGWLARIGFIVIGASLTLVMQSSSAAMAVTLSAAAGGIVDLHAAGAMVIGANLGTTSTALLASVGATPMARRTAAGHVVFNLVAALAALALLPWMLDLVQLALRDGGGYTEVAPTLAVFHTAFNLLGVLLMWPLSGRLVKQLEQRWVTDEEERGKPLHLDKNVMAVPAVGLSAAVREMRRLASHAAELVATALAPGELDELALERGAAALERLAEAVSGFVAQMDRQNVSAETAERIQDLLKAWRHYETALEQARLLGSLRASSAETVPHAATLTGPVAESLRAVLRAADVEAEGFDISACEQAVGRMEERFEVGRDEALARAADGSIDVATALARQRLLAEARRAVRHLARGARALDSLSRSRDARG